MSFIMKLQTILNVLIVILIAKIAMGIIATTAHHA